MCSSCQILNCFMRSQHYHHGAGLLVIHPWWFCIDSVINCHSSNSNSMIIIYIKFQTSQIVYHSFQTRYIVMQSYPSLHSTVSTPVSSFLLTLLLFIPCNPTTAMTTKYITRSLFWQHHLAFSRLQVCIKCFLMLWKEWNDCDEDLIFTYVTYRYHSPVSQCGTPVTSDGKLVRVLLTLIWQLYSWLPRNRDVFLLWEMLCYMKERLSSRQVTHLLSFAWEMP